MELFHYGSELAGKKILFFCSIFVNTSCVFLLTMTRQTFIDLTMPGLQLATNALKSFQICNSGQWQSLFYILSTFYWTISSLIVFFYPSPACKILRPLKENAFLKKKKKEKEKEKEKKTLQLNFYYNGKEKQQDKNG